MGDLWLLLLLPLSLGALHGVKGCLDCDPKFKEDIKTLLAKLVPSEVPGRTDLLERQIKEILHISSKVSHGSKMLRVLAVQNVVNLRTWLKNEFYKLGNETWKGAIILQGKIHDVRHNLESKMKETLKAFSELACSEDCIVTEGPVLDCWSCLRISTQCFRGEYCEEEDPKNTEKQEISLFLILLAEGTVLGSILLLFHICVSHRRKMKAIRRSLRKYLEKKLEELMDMMENKEGKLDLRIGK